MSDVDATIADLAPRLAAGELTAEALLDACLERIARHDGRLHAMLRLDPSAREQARTCDRKRQRGEPLGLLHGMPVVVKDNIDVADLPTTSGCRALAGAMPRGDAGQVARLRRAGAVIIGKTNLSELSFEIRARSSLGGDTLNPFRRDAEVTCGGSSGGTAVAVASGFAVAGLGTDTGGSIRVPAAYNGLVGLRATFGRLDLAGAAPLAPLTDTIGPIGRSVSDVARLFAVMAGSQISDLPPVAGMRVGMLRQAFGGIAAIGRVTEGTAAALADAGAAIVDPVALPEHLLPIGGAHIVDAEFANAFDAYLASAFEPGTAPASLAAILASDDFLPEHRAALESRIRRRGEGRAAILARHALLRAGLEQLMATNALDALMYPTSAVVPDTLDNPAGGWAPELAACSGWPGLSVPSGTTLDAIPIGVELLAPAGGEARLFALAAAIEAAAGSRLLPPLD